MKNILVLASSQSGRIRHQHVEFKADKYCINHVALLTLTFGVPGSGRGSQATRELREQAKDLEFVLERWHSLNSNVIAKRYPDWICVLETHKDGVWHLHVVVATKFEERTHHGALKR